MLLGADTGFLFKYASHHPRAVQLWSETRNGEHRLIFSVLSVTEYLAYNIPRGTDFR